MPSINFAFGVRADLHFDYARDTFDIYLKEFTDEAKFGFKTRVSSELLAMAPVVPLVPSLLRTPGDNDYDPHLAVWSYPFRHKIPIEGQEGYIVETKPGSHLTIIQLRHAVDWKHQQMQAVEFKTITGPIDRNIWPKKFRPLHESNGFRLPYYEKVPQGGEYPESSLETLHDHWESLEEIGIVPKEE
jgi:hypothetical protein